LRKKNQNVVILSEAKNEKIKHFFRSLFSLSGLNSQSAARRQASAPPTSSPKGFVLGALTADVP
jgi:hypothetical protein